MRVQLKSLVHRFMGTFPSVGSAQGFLSIIRRFFLYLALVVLEWHPVRKSLRFVTCGRVKSGLCLPFVFLSPLCLGLNLALSEADLHFYPFQFAVSWVNYDRLYKC